MTLANGFAQALDRDIRTLLLILVGAAVLVIAGVAILSWLTRRKTVQERHEGFPVIPPKAKTDPTPGRPE